MSCRCSRGTERMWTTTTLRHGRHDVSECFIVDPGSTDGIDVIIGQFVDVLDIATNCALPPGSLGHFFKISTT